MKEISGLQKRNRLSLLIVVSENLAVSLDFIPCSSYLFTSLVKGILMDDPKEISKQEEADIENPGNTLLYSEPIFLINKSPKAADLAMAEERGVPVVVIMSLDMFPDIQERQIWQVMNVPELNNVCVDWAGDHSNVVFVQNKWREIVKIRHDSVKATMAQKYYKLTGKPNYNSIQINPVMNDFMSILIEKSKKINKERKKDPPADFIP
jgi:hypothetical protein